MRPPGAVTFDDIDEDPPDGPVSIEPPGEFHITAHLISVTGDHLTESDWCWCQPTILAIPPNGEIILHRRTMDGFNE